MRQGGKWPEFCPSNKTRQVLLHFLTGTSDEPNYIWFHPFRDSTLELVDTSTNNAKHYHHKHAINCLKICTVPLLNCTVHTWFIGKIIFHLKEIHLFPKKTPFNYFPNNQHLKYMP